GKTAQLEFRIVDDGDRSLQGMQLPPGVKLDIDGSGAPYVEGENQKQLQDLLKDKAPAGRVFALGRIEEVGKPVRFRTYLLEDKAALTGESPSDARAPLGEDGGERKPHVALTFNRRGAELFEELTGKNVQKRMAIVLDGIVDSAPVIQDKIGGGHA